MPVGSSGCRAQTAATASRPAIDREREVEVAGHRRAAIARRHEALEEAGRGRPSGVRAPWRVGIDLDVPRASARTGLAERARPLPAARATLGGVTMDDERWEPGMPVPSTGRRSGPRRRRRCRPASRACPHGPCPRSRRRRSSSTTSTCRSIVLICGAIAITALELGAPTRQPARQAVRPHRHAAARRDHDGRCGRADLALGLGLDGRRPRQGPVPAGLGRRQPRSASARSWSARSSCCIGVIARRVRTRRRTAVPPTSPSGGGVPPGSVRA